jgi:transcriptional regulator with XRE-family HTH domain
MTATKMTKIIQNNLRKLLAIQNLTRPVFAKKIKASPKAVQLWVLNKKLPNLKYIPRMMDALKVKDQNQIFLIKEAGNKQDNKRK